MRNSSLPVSGMPSMLGWFWNAELNMIRKETAVVQWRYYTGNCLDGLRKTSSICTRITGVQAEVWSGGVSSPEILVCNESLVAKAWHVPWFYERRMRYVNVLGNWECVEWRYKAPKIAILQVDGCSVDKFCLPKVKDVMNSDRVSRTLAGTFEHITELLGFVEGEEIRGITEHLLASQKKKKASVCLDRCVDSIRSHWGKSQSGLFFE